MKRLCVFCGSSPGANPAYMAAARAMGLAMAEKGIGLVYGGGGFGMMGELAEKVLAQGGEVIGVIPDFLTARELAKSRLTDLHIVKSMHERKALMAELADGFIALPGGIGTIEEFCEIITWVQLNLHAKPCGILNVGGYFDGLINFLDHAAAQGFIQWVRRPMFHVATEPRELLGMFLSDASRTGDLVQPEKT